MSRKDPERIKRILAFFLPILIILGTPAWFLISPMDKASPSDAVFSYQERLMVDIS